MRYSFLVKEWGIHSSLRNEVFLKSVEKKKTLTWESHQNGSAKQNTQRISQLYKAQGWQAPPDHLVKIWSTAVREHLQWENICGGDGHAGYMVSNTQKERVASMTTAALAAPDAEHSSQSPEFPPFPIWREVFDPKEALSQMTLPAGDTSVLRNLEGHQSPGHQQKRCRGLLPDWSLSRDGRKSRNAHVCSVTAQVTMMHSKVRNPRLHFQREKN